MLTCALSKVASSGMSTVVCEGGRSRPLFPDVTGWLSAKGAASLCCAELRTLSFVNLSILSMMRKAARAWSMGVAILVACPLKVVAKLSIRYS